MEHPVLGPLLWLPRGQTPKGIKIRINRKRDQGASFHVQGAEANISLKIVLNGKVCMPCLLRKRSRKIERPILIAHIVTPPPRSAASPSIWAQRDAVPQRKDYIIEQQNALNAPGYISKVWAHYNTFRGAPFPHKMSQSEGVCPNQSPNQTPMRPRQCHSCASQRHPDTMHNITPPH